VRPTLVDVLGALSARVFGELLPALPAGYLQSDAMMMALLLAGAAEEHERAAEVRSTDIEDVRRVFRRALPHLTDGRLQDTVAAAVDLAPKSLRISDLDACGDKLSAALIELHAAVEQSEDPWAREIEREIWAALRASTVRRALATNPF
jgi:hypothetical protein